MTPPLTLPEAAPASVCRPPTRLGLFCASCLAASLYLAAPLLAQSHGMGMPEEDFFVSPDITFDWLGIVVDDDGVVRAKNPGMSADLGFSTAGVAVGAFDETAEGLFFVLDQATELPGPLFAEPRDIVLDDGSSYRRLFHGSARGVPSGARIDALLLQGGAIYMSFDITVEIDGLTIDDEDLVFFDQGTSAWKMVLDSSEHGITPALDLDALGVTSNSDVALSFDGSGVVDGVTFDDEDVLEADLGTENGWQLIYDGSAASPGWRPADLDALLIAPPPEGLLFLDGFELGNLSAWSGVQP